MFCLDENGNPTKNSAVTANHCPLFFRDGTSFANYHYFLAYKNRVYMLEKLGSIKNDVWSLDFSKVLAPAEIATAKLDGSKVDVISVLQTLCAQFSSRTKIPFYLNLQEDLDACPLDFQKAQFVTRIANEILANIEKHSYASQFKLFIRTENNGLDGGNFLNLIFIDDGVGCDLTSRFSQAKTIRP